MLTQAERCSVFLVDKMTNELVAKVFDGTLVDGEEIKRGPEIRLPINKGVAGKHSYIYKTKLTNDVTITAMT